MEEWTYKKFDPETGTVRTIPLNDHDGSITGKYILGLKSYFDENPDEYKRLGFIKMIDDPDAVQHDSQTQFVTTSAEMIDEHTARVVYNVIDKTEEMMFLEDLFATSNLNTGITYNVVGHD